MWRPPLSGRLTRFIEGRGKKTPLTLEDEGYEREI
jgi:hypothetical protein